MPTTYNVERVAATADFTFQVGALTVEDLLVTGFRGAEGINRLFEFQIDLCSANADVAFADVVGKPCVLQIRGNGGSRYVNGIVRRFERLGEGSSLTYYSAEVVPSFWLLTRRVKSRVIEVPDESGISFPDVIKKVIEDAGLSNFRMACSDTHAKREYVVQYRESDWDFILRLAEEEGIYFFFEHSADGHKMVVADKVSVHVASPTQPTVPFRGPTGLIADQGRETIVRIRAGEEVQFGAVHLADFNLTQPQNKLRATATAQSQTSLEFSDYPARFQESAAGTKLATWRLEEFQGRIKTQTMLASSRGQIPGFKFTLEEHPVEGMNIEYLVTQVRHLARQSQSGQEESGAPEEVGYSAELETIPAAVQYRAPRVTPRPTINGTQTAIVVGPSGEEIYVDQYGRVKVQFHWDREGSYDDKSSFWVRVAQPAAGGGYGMLFIPRVGQEVVVSFLEGDPDRPLIVGSVYNNATMPAYGLPDKKTVSYIKTNSSPGGGGTNEIRFDDTKDAEQLLFNATKDMHFRIIETRKTFVGKDEHVMVKGDVFQGYEKAQSLKVGTDFNGEVGGNYSMKVTGNGGVEYGSNHSVKTGSNLYLKSGAALVIEGTSEISLKAGGSFIKIDSSGVTIQGTAVKINSGGSAGSGSLVSLTAPTAAQECDEVEPGADVTYSPQAAAFAASAAESLADQDEETEEQQEDSWIEIELTDEEGNPVPNEEYCVTLPNGRKLWGRLDQNGLAKVYGIPPGQCEVTFPAVDREGWRR